MDKMIILIKLYYISYSY